MKKLVSFVLVLSMLCTITAIGASDVQLHWVKEDITFLKEQDIISNVSESFYPDRDITRAEFITMLCRTINLEMIDYQGQFADVNENDWYANVLASAFESQLINKHLLSGYNILPNNFLTRQEMAVLVSYAVEYTGKALNRADMSSFLDYDSIQAWAKESVEKSFRAGLILGVTAAYYKPDNTITRAQAATVIKKVYQFLTDNDHSSSENDEVPATESVNSATKPAPEGDIREHFPVYQAATVKTVGGNQAGFGMVGEFDKGGPKEIYVKYTPVNSYNPQTATFQFMSYVRVIDPQGKTAAYYDLSKIDGISTSFVLQVPNGEAGIWRVSFVGGYTGSKIEIGMPNTKTWGVQGEPLLGITDTLPKTMYLYVPKTTKRILFLTYGSGAQTPDIDIQDASGKSMGKAAYNSSIKRNELLIENPVPDSVMQIKHQGKEGEYLNLANIPGLLCPTQDMARKLQGLTVEAGGLLVQGAYQKRVRERMLQFKPEDFEVEIDWDMTIPDTVENLDLEVLPYSAYGGLSTIKYAFDNQILDPQSPFYGAYYNNAAKGRFEQSHIDNGIEWTSFLYNTIYNETEPGSLSAVATLDTKFNPVYNNKQMINRSVLALCALLVRMTNYTNVVDSGFDNNDYPLGQIFFTYGSAAETLMYLKGYIDDETWQLLRDGMILWSDQLGNFCSYQPNQYNNVLLGHLAIYSATGETRFLKRFEYMVGELIKYRPNNKHSFHEAGYFMEELGPDGNYEHMNIECFAINYFRYRAMPTAKPELVKQLESVIDRSVRFQSLFWLVQPDGQLMAPNALNSRTITAMSDDGHVNVHGVYKINAMAAARYYLSKYPDDGFGKAKVISYIANTEQWRKNILQWGIESKGDGFAGGRKGVSGAWGRWSFEQFSATPKEDEVKPATIPVFEQNKIWDAKGLLAIKTGELYTSFFYGSDNAPNSYKSGLPLSFWTKDTGAVVLSMKKNSVNHPKALDDVLCSTIAGSSAGNVFTTTGEEGVIKWLKKDKEFQITSTLKDPSATIIYHYVIKENQLECTITPRFDKEPETMYVNLPILLYDSNAKITQADNGIFSFEMNGKTIEITYPQQAKTQLSDTMQDAYFKKDFKNLKIHFLGFGRPIKLTFTVK